MCMVLILRQRSKLPTIQLVPFKELLFFFFFFFASFHFSPRQKRRATNRHWLRHMGNSFTSSSSTHISRVDAVRHFASFLFAPLASSHDNDSSSTWLISPNNSVAHDHDFARSTLKLGTRTVWYVQYYVATFHSPTSPRPPRMLQLFHAPTNIRLPVENWSNGYRWRT
jgi:hypothetical protein